MAGSLGVVDEGNVVTAIKEEWEVQFSRFFNYPAPMSSTCPGLVPLPQFMRNRGLLGTWLVSSSPALLRFVVLRSSAGVVLTISCAGKLQEEHYVSKLNFSWPQVSCISGFPARGTRAVVVSYRDRGGEIQKFAFRFSTTGQAEEFIYALKDILKGESDIKPRRSVLVSAVPSPSQYISSNTPLYRASNDSSIVNSVTDFTPELPHSSNSKAEPPTFIQQTMPINFLEFPPSFTSLLTDYCPVVEQVVKYPSACEEAALKSQIAKYMEDSSFQDMLIKVEKAITEMGGENQM